MFEWGTSLIRRYIFLLSFIYWFRPEASGTDQISQKYTDSCYTKIAPGKVICNPESGKLLRLESGILGLEFVIQLKEYGLPLTTGIRIPSSTDKGQRIEKEGRKTACAFRSSTLTQSLAQDNLCEVAPGYNQYKNSTAERNLAVPAWESGISEFKTVLDILKFLHDSEVLGSKLQIFQDSIVSQFPKETWAQRKPQTKYRKMTRKPRSYVRILIYRTWPITFTCGDKIITLAIRIHWNVNHIHTTHEAYAY